MVIRSLKASAIDLALQAEALPYARRAVEIYTRLGSPDLEKARAMLRECEEKERLCGGPS